MRLLKNHLARQLNVQRFLRGFRMNVIIHRQQTYCRSKSRIFWRFHLAWVCFGNSVVLHIVWIYMFENKAFVSPFQKIFVKKMGVFNEKMYSMSYLSMGNSSENNTQIEGIDITAILQILWLKKLGVEIKQIHLWLQRKSFPSQHYERPYFTAQWMKSDL